MKWTENTIRNIIADLAEDNPFACRALFSITTVTFTLKAPTLSVSLSKTPTLFINREFLEGNAQTEDDIKALLMHEFLHVVLMHTEKYTLNNPLMNIALDAVINSIIHRTYGKAYSNFFSRYYRPKGMEILLRPWEDTDMATTQRWRDLHTRIYAGAIAGDDLIELLESLREAMLVIEYSRFIGSHDEWNKEISEENRELLDGILDKMEGTGIWSKKQLPGKNDLLQQQSRRLEKMKVNSWNRETLRVLEKCMRPDPKAIREDASVLRLPILSNNDRRSFARLRTDAILPFSAHEYVKRMPSESVNIYLDVSGSMNAEIDRLITLLSGFRSHIRRPLWVFSNKVDKAVFRNGKIEYESTGGTSISCVFDHIREKGFRRSLIVTDGYVESISPVMLRGISLRDLHVLVSANGQGQPFYAHGIRYHQLKPVKP